MRQIIPARSFPYPVQVAALAVLYLGVAKLSLLLAIPPGYASAVWPPSGVALAVLLLGGNRLWPGVWLGAAAANLLVQSSIPAAILIGSGNALEAFIGATLIRRYVGVPRCFNSGEDVFRFVAIGALASTVAATVGVSAIAVTGAIPLGDFAAHWWTWWQGDVSGIIVVTPLLLCATARRAVPVESTWRKLEMTGFALALAIAAYSVSASGETSLGFFPPLFLLTFPFIVWAAFRFDQLEVTATIAALCAIAITSTIHGATLVAGSVNASLLLLLAFISVVGVTGLVLSAVVGERRRAMEALRKGHAELEQRERRMHEFMAMLAHELRNPLTPIRNAIDLMRIKPADGPTQGWSRDIIDRQLTHLTRLVDDLLDVGRITSGKIVLHKEPVDINAAVLRAAEAIRPAADAGGLTLDVRVAPATLFIEGDLIRFSQAVLNLLNNSVKYTRPGGTIAVEVEREDAWAVVRVKDTGVGITGELLPSIFDLFVQGERSLERAEGGLGIGLTVVQRLVSLHGGSVEARSEGPGRGSEFVIRLPAMAQESVPRRSESDSSHVLQRRRVLIVDDHRDSTDTMAALVAAWGHDVRSLYDGPSTIPGVREFRPHVIILDIGLPGMDGYEVATTLRRVANGSPPVLIAFTGYGQDDDRRRAREAGFDHHLVKPLDPAALEKILDSVPESAGQT